MSQLSWDVFVAPELALAGDDLPPGLSTRTWGPVSATLIMGREDAVLVDALLTTAQATALAGWIQARGSGGRSVHRPPARNPTRRSADPAPASPSS